MTTVTDSDGTTGSEGRLAKAGQWLSGISALLSAAAVLMLIITGHTEHISPVAALGAAALVGGTVITVRVNVVRR
ncbi:hypothetical protein [Streptomyces sp. NPDC090036]|uniref:hypothetical protein n=1 Tax=Streptomyces sp. NPDC090036 TaxID=3365926 RepID=UPI0037FEF94A